MKMRTCNRAILYITRKKSKSLLLLLVFWVLFTLVMTGISISNAASDATRELRHTLGGYFKLEENLEFKGKRKAITDEMVERINKLEGIKSSNKMNTQYLFTPELTLEAGRFTGEGDEKAHLARFLGNSDSSLHEFFVLNSFHLIQGRHIEPGDIGKAVISDKLAGANDLKLGDSIGGILYTEDDSSTIGTYDWEVVGIFQDNSSQASKALAAECDIRDNFIFVDEVSLMRVQTDQNAQNVGKYRVAAFFVDDPAKLEQIVQEVSEIKDVDWDSFQISENNDAYDKAAAPMDKLEKQTQIMLLVIITISVILVTLILCMWMRDRLRETGVFLSIGIHKMSIIGQHMIEVLIIVIAALVLTFPTSGFISDYAGNMILETDTTVEQEREDHQIFDEPLNLKASTEQLEVTVSIGVKEFWFVALYGIGLSLISVGVSSVLIMCMKPKDILTVIE